MIRLFPLPPEEIASWSKTITRLYPDATPKLIGTIIDKFITAEWEYDTAIGIRNIFLGIKELTSLTPSNYIAP